MSEYSGTQGIQGEQMEAIGINRILVLWDKPEDSAFKKNLKSVSGA